MRILLLLAAAASASAAAPAPAPVAVPESRGAQLMAESRYSEAIPHLEREVRADPGSPSLLLNLGWSYWHARRIGDAWRIASTLVKLDPGNRTFLIFMANTNIEMGSYHEAARLMRRALRSAPGDRDASMVLARALFRTGRRKEAMEIVETLIARFPDDDAARYRKAVFLSDMGRRREALDLLEALLAKTPDEASYRRSRARLLAEMGRRREAKEEWLSLTRRALDAQSLMNLGWSYWRESNLDAAWEIAVALVKLDDKNPAFLRFMANLEMERQNDENALRLAERTVRLAPEDQDAALTLSKALFRMQRVAEATAVLEKQIARHPDSVAVQYRWAELLAGSQRHAEALNYYDRLIKADPANETYRANRAAVLYEMGRYDEALAEWRARAELPTPDLAAIVRLRDDAVNRRAWGEAAGWQTRLVEADPRDPAGWETLSRLFFDGKLPFKALWAVERAIASDPVLINPYYLKAEILESMEDWGAAAIAYDEILRRNPNSVRAYEGMSYIMEARRDHAGALRNMDRAEALTAADPSPYLVLHRARVLADSGKTGKAHRLLTRLEADPQPVIPVILYHGLARGERGDSIPASVFRAQMKALKEKGYRTVTVTQLAAALRGKAKLPEKPLLVTFDDGRVDSFTLADPVLKETGFVATMFVHVSRLRRPYFHSGREDIARWHATGRWDLQAHGSQAHDPLSIDGFGRRGHFLPNRKWLAAERRLETLAEYRARIENDYIEAKRGVEEIVPGHKVVGFAFPFGDYGQNDYSNTPEAAGLNQALVRKEYDVAFVQTPQGVNYLSSNPTDLRRFSVPRHMSAGGLVSRLALSDARVQSRLHHAQLWMRAGQTGRGKAVFAELDAMGLGDEPQVMAERAIALQRSGDVSYARELFTRAAEREADPDGPVAVRNRARMAQAVRDAGPAAGAEFQRFTDSDSNAITKVLLRGSGPAGPVRLEGWAGSGDYSDRRDPSSPAPAIRSVEGGVGARWFASRSVELAGSYTRRNYDRDAGSADDYAASASWQAIPALLLSVRDGLGAVETAAGIRAGRRFRSDGGGLTWDPALNWRVNADFDQSRYNDSNRTQDLRLRVTNYLTQRFALGAVFYHREARRVSPEYYTPLRLNQYTGVVTVTEPFGPVSPRTGLARAVAQLQYEAGYGVQDSGSRRAHSVRAELGLNLGDRASLRLTGQYSQSPTYTSRRGDAALSVRF